MRRPFLALALAAASVAPLHAAPRATNVIVFVGNGMGPAVKTAARLMRYKEEGTLAIDTMPYAARLRTYSLDAQATDGAAAVTALMTGVKVRNRVVAMDGATRALGFAPGKDAVRGIATAENRCPANGNGAPSATLLELAIAEGKSAGVVTTSRLTGGPAAAAYAHVCHRDAEYEVARQAVPGGAGYNARLGKGLDVLMGGASAYWRPFDAAKRPRGRPDGRELVGELQSGGYTVATDVTAMNAAPFIAGSRLVGLFDGAEPDAPMADELDRDPAREPSLAQMTAKAIDVLSSNPKGFVLVVQGGRIAGALTASRAKRALVDAIAFDDAVKLALEKVDLAHTLVVVTGANDQAMAFIGGGRRGSDVMGLHLNPVSGKPSVDAGGLPYTALVFGAGPNRPDRRAALDTPTVLGNDYQQESAFKLASAVDGAGDVTIHASGAGANAFKGSFDNTKVFTLIRQAAGF